MSPTITPAQIPDALTHAGVPGLEILSLDCFDTLLWRSTYAPTDVFAALAPQPGLRCRVFAESFARQLRRVEGRPLEVDLDAIYRQLIPGNGPAEHARRQRDIARELAAERNHCFGFEPTVELMRRARVQGLRVVVVSDTYLSEEQLRELLRTAGGAEVDALIDRVFVSSEFGVPKAGGLFGHVLAELGVAPGHILHLGDNPIADVEAPHAFGIHALHLLQFGDELSQRLRFEAAMSRVFDPEIGISRPVYQPHRAPVSVGHTINDDPAWALGYGVVGPIFEGFARWLRAEADELGRESSNGLKLLFLLRDGHLPERVYATVHGGAGHSRSRVELSRFAAFAASFTDRESVLSYVAEFGESKRFDALSRQLLFTEAEARDLANRLRRADRPLQAYVAEITRPKNLRKIVDRSSAYAERLIAYLVQHAGVEPGQTLMFVDLGYAGTVQQRLGPVLRERLGVRVEGRYLLMREVPNWQFDRRGLIDPSRYDYRVIDSICAYIAIIEQLSTAEMPTVVDYTPDGEPVHKSGDIKERQSDIRTRAQHACLAYAADARNAFHQLPSSIGIESWRCAVTGLLGRLLFLPSPAETELFAGFEHDVNMGVDDKVTLFDPAAARDGLLKRGLIYSNDSPRQYLPAEMRGQGLSLSLSMLSLRRFTPDLRYTDFSDRQLNLPIMVASGAELVSSEAVAHPTHDGYFLAAIPVADGSLAIGVNFGRVFSWLQLYSVTSTRVKEFMSDGDLTNEIDRGASLLFEGIERHDGGILRCEGDESFVFVPPRPSQTGEKQVLSVVFRPLSPAKPVTGTAAGSAESRRLVGIS